MSRPASEAEYLANLVPASVRGAAIGRRQLLRGAMAGAGLLGASGLLAACGGGSSSSSGGGSGGGGGAASGTLTFGSNQSDAVPKKAYQDLVAGFGNQAIQVKTNTVDHNTFQEQINNYLQGQPDDVFTWFAGYRMRFFAAQGLAGDVSDVWQNLNGFSDAMKAASTGDDGKQYFVPLYNYPWAVFYRPSVWSKYGYQVPTTLDQLVTLSKQMQKDGLVPIAFADKDGWPAMGTFDILNMRINGYQFHIDLMAGKEKWTDPKVTTVFNTFKDLLPYHQNGAAGRTWQDAAQALVQKKAGMYLLGMFVSQQFQTAGAADLADLDFFPYPSFGTQYDAEKALDAPIDGFMLSKNSPTLSADMDTAKAFLEYLAQPATQVSWVTQDPSNIAAVKNADTSKYTPLQLKAAQLIGDAQRITQFLDRDTNPNFAGANGMQAFLLDFIKSPNQDLAAFQKKIQDFWDTL
jgi:multiple sugar transport system substrate-binding protein